MKRELIAYGVDYDSLPSETHENFYGRFVAKVKTVTFAILKITVVIPIIWCLGGLLAVRLSSIFTHEEKNLTPFARQRLKEIEKNVQTNVQTNAQTRAAKKINVLLLKDGQDEGAEAAVSSIYVSSNFLIKPKDLPESLNLALLDNQMLTEEEWIIRFILWREAKLLTVQYRHRSQFGIEHLILNTKNLLKRWRRQTSSAQNEAILAHELGHIYHHHIIKQVLATFGWDLLAVLTLGISTLFQNKVINKLKRQQEFEADAFSAIKLVSAKGHIKNFKESLSKGKILHQKYPKLYDKVGNYRKSKTHPPLMERIARLKALGINDQRV